MNDITQLQEQVNELVAEWQAERAAHAPTAIG
jgi:hypothetical protein